MATNEQAPVVGVFTSQEEAREAVRALKAAGFTDSHIGVASSNRDGGGGDGDDGDDAVSGEGALAGAATGAAAGMGIGALWGLGILAGVLPAIGPAIAGGTLAALLSSAAAGAAAVGLGGALMGMGLSRDEAEYYDEELKSGRTIVTVQAGDRRQEALMLLRRHGAYDISSRSAEHQDTGSQTHQDASSTSTSTTGQTGAAYQRSSSHGTSNVSSEVGDTYQAREEQLRVDKTPVETGEVTVRKEVHHEHKTIEVPVYREEVVVERREGGGQAVSGEGLAAGEEIRIPIREEQVNVEKQVVVAEEVSVGKRKVMDTERVDETLRKERIDVQTTGDADVRDRRD